MKYAVFGGTFDPIHTGHLALAEAVKDQLGLDLVILVPNARNPLRRQAHASSADRLKMCQLALEGHPGLVVSDVEVSRGGKSFMVDTLEELHMTQPGHAWLVMGTDALANFVQWRKPIRICQIARLAVIERPGKSLETAIASLPESICDVLDVVKLPPNRTASNIIRDLIARGEPADLWLHPKVWEYIVERGLYQIK